MTSRNLDIAIAAKVARKALYSLYALLQGWLGVPCPQEIWTSPLLQKLPEKLSKLLKPLNKCSALHKSSQAYCKSFASQSDVWKQKENGCFAAKMSFLLLYWIFHNHLTTKFEKRYMLQTLWEVNDHWVGWVWSLRAIRRSDTVWRSQTRTECKNCDILVSRCMALTYIFTHRIGMM